MLLPLRLPLVLPAHELSGRRPREFERLVRGCNVGDASHRALLFAGEAIASHALAESLAPSARAVQRQLLGAARRFAEGTANLSDTKGARSTAFDGAGDAESATLSAVARAVAIDEADPLDRQAALSVRRYAARGVHHAVACVLMTLDAVTKPAALLPIAEEAAGAIAFTRVALGAARSPDLRAAARQQARWEAARLASNEQPTLALELQLYCEYLGAHWKDHADAQRAAFDEFLEWALGV